MGPTIARVITMRLGTCLARGQFSTQLLPILEFHGNRKKVEIYSYLPVKVVDNQKQRAEKRGQW